MALQRQERRTVSNTVEELLDASKVVEHRLGLKPPEEKRVMEAYDLLAEGQIQGDAKGDKQRRVYLEFLQRVQKVAGYSKVVLCAAALGLSAVAGMKDRVRVDLPVIIREQERPFQDDVPQSLANKFFPQLSPGGNLASEITPPGLIVRPMAAESAYSGPNLEQAGPWDNGQAVVTAPFTGDVYELTIDDVRTVGMSTQISGKIRLTDAYGAYPTSFITIPISNESADHFIMQRPRVMQYPQPLITLI